MTTKPMYTIVEHAAAREHPDFARDVQERVVHGRVQQEAIRKVGGLLFESWHMADSFCEQESYQGGNTSPVADVPGTFSPSVRVGGLRVYIPRDPLRPGEFGTPL